MRAGPVRYVVGDATAPAAPGPAIVAHVCNDVGAFGRGFAAAVSRRWPEVRERYLAWTRTPGFRLGAVQVVQVRRAPDLCVVNMLAQRGLPSRTNRHPLDLAALGRCLAEVARDARRFRADVHMPRIGTGYGGARWADVAALVEKYLAGAGVPVTVYDLAARAPTEPTEE